MIRCGRQSKLYDGLVMKIKNSCEKLNGTKMIGHLADFICLPTGQREKR